jgi:hypothetical protein
MYSETMDKEATYMPLVFHGHVNTKPESMLETVIYYFCLLLVGDQDRKCDFLGHFFQHHTIGAVQNFLRTAGTNRRTGVWPYVGYMHMR